MEVDQRREFGADIQRLLDERAGRLASGDVDGFLGPLTDAARRSEKPIADGFLAVQAADPSFLVQMGSLTASRAPAEVAARFEYRPPALPDDNSFSFPITYRVIEGGDGLRIGESHPDQLPIWASGPVEVHRSPHFVALARPAAFSMDALLQTAETARSAIAGRLPVEQDAQGLIVAAPNHEEFQRLVSPSEDSAEGRVAQVSTTLQVTRSEVLVQGRHIVVNLEQLERDRTGPETFRHELAHLALAKVTRPSTPGWVAEGAAMFVAGSRPVAAWQEGVAEGRFTALDFETTSASVRLGEHSSTGTSATDEYALAIAAVGYLVETFGADRFWEFYRSFSERPAAELYDAFPQGGDAPGTDGIEELRTTATEDSLRTNFQLSWDQLNVGVGTWLQKTTRG